MTRFHTARRALKRGSLVAAANWPIVIIQASADMLSKLVMLVPFVAGIFLVVLLVGAEPDTLLRLRGNLPGTIFALLVARPIAFASFLAAMAVAVVGGSVFTFLIKGGSVGLLVRAERDAPLLEEPPLRGSLVSAASVFSVEGFIEASRALFPRYLRLGGVLLLAYALPAVVVLVAAVGGMGDGWFVTLLASVVVVCYITAVNLVYLLAQIVMAAEQCNVGVALRRVATFARRTMRTVAGICLVVLGLVVLVTAASFIATTAFGLISFVPFVGLAVLPLQLLAWVLRALVLQYIGLASVGAYAAVYRGHASARAEPADSVVVRATPAEAG